MHLCVGSKYFEVYRMACTLVEKLLENIYQTYEKLNKGMNKEFERPLRIKKVEDLDRRVQGEESERVSKRIEDEDCGMKKSIGELFENSFNTTLEDNRPYQTFRRRDKHIIAPRLRRNLV